MIYATNTKVSPENLTLTVGKWYYDLCATVEPSNATCKSVWWYSSDPRVVAVNYSNGYILARKPGTAKIYAAVAYDDHSSRGYCTVTVAPPVPVTDITINRPDATLCKGESLCLWATVSPSNATDRSVRWVSSDPTIVYVNATTGEITAKAGGKATVCAIANDGSGKRGCCEITVIQNSIKPSENRGENDSNAAERKFADPVDVYTGAHTIKNTVMSLFGGQGLSLVAEYDSTRLTAGELGVGWYHNFEKRVEFECCEAKIYQGPSTYSRYESNEDCTVYSCTAANKKGYILTVDRSKEYPYTVNCNSESTEYYDSLGRLAKMVDHNGFETHITYSSGLTTITDAVSGKKIYLEKNTAGKIVRVYDDDNRQATMTYNGNMLVSLCDLNGNSLTYTYNEIGQILTGTDSKGVCYFTNTYDVYGRVVTQKDGILGSAVSTFSYEANGKRVTTNRNGDQSVRIFNIDGLLTSYTDENGNTKTYKYDSSYNIIKETDANGHSVTKSYNSFNKPTVIIDKNGNKTYLTYDEAGNVAKISYPEIEGVVPEETFAYNARNQLIRHTDLRGTVTVYTYDTASMPASKKVGAKAAELYSYQSGLLKSKTDALGNTTQYGHNTIGQVTSVTDADNRVTLYEYDPCGNLLKTTDANGKTVTTTYDGNHQKTSVTDANGNKTEYTYNGNMMNDIVKLPNGTFISYEFDGEDRPVKVTDQAGNVTLTQYDKAGRVVCKLFADGGTISYEYDAVGNVLKETNPKGATVTKTYDANGNVLTATDNFGNTTRYQYNALSKVIRAVNAVSGTTTYVYSPAGDLLCETDPFGNSKTYTYDPFGNRLTATDAKGNVTTYTYDANNNLLTARDPLGNTTTNTYNSLNQLVSVKDAKNNTVRYGYDALGRRTTVTDAKNNTVTTVYDGNGNVLQTIDAKGNTVSQTVYNNVNLPQVVTDAAGRSVTYTYTAHGKVETTVDSLNRRQEYVYNSRGQNTEVKDAANGVSRAVYDTLGNVTCLSGPLGAATNYTYDDMGRLIAETTSSGGTVSYGYNELNLKEQLTNARGQARKFFYDQAGRIVGYVGAEDSVSYTYDANGNILTVTDKNGTITRTYDALNRVASCTDTFGKTIRYEYDAVGKLSRIIYPDGTAVSYTYDANGNLLSVTDWANRVTTYSYDVNNKVIGVVKPNGSVTTTVYDNAHRVTSTVEKTMSGAVISGFEYVYDSLSRIVEEKHLANSVTMCYTYDSLSRVTKRVVKNFNDVVVNEEDYSYDAAGNVTDAPDSCFVYDTNNRLTVFNGSPVTYDLDGNMLSNGCASFVYDSANRLIKAGDHAYTYNAEDVRIRNLCGEADTTYTYDTNCRLSQLLEKTTNGVVTKYVYGLGLIGEEKNGEFKTYHFDSRGSTVAITDIIGNVTDAFTYDTYGNLVSRCGSSEVIFGYNGRDGVVTDKNGLIYMRARYYSPDMRRFVNADIIPGRISNVTTLNRYAYANDNPTMYIDPTGRIGVFAALGVAAAVVGLCLTLSGDTGPKKSSSSSNKKSNNKSKTKSSSSTAKSSTPKTTPSDLIPPPYFNKNPNMYINSHRPILNSDEKTRQYERIIIQQDLIAAMSGTEPPNAELPSSKQAKNKLSDSDIIGFSTQIGGVTADIIGDVGEAAAKDYVLNAPRPNNIAPGTWAKQVNLEIARIEKGADIFGYASTGLFTLLNTGVGCYENVTNNAPTSEIVSDAVIDIGGGALSIGTSYILATYGTSISPGLGTVIGLGVGLIYDFVIDPLLDAAIE